MRRAIAIQVVLCLIPALFSAPFLHLHGHEDSAHVAAEHGSRAVIHTHLHRGETSADPHAPLLVSSDDGSDAVFLNWLQNNPQPAPQLVFVPVESTLIPNPEPTPFRVEVTAPCSHDPPRVFALNPRSPPVLPASVAD